MAGEFGGLSFRGGIASLMGAIGRFFTGFGGITARDILRSVAYLKDNVTAIETQHTGFLWGLGRMLGTALGTVGTFIRDHSRAALKFLDGKITTLAKWLKDKFGPVLAFLKLLKDHVDEIYRKWVKPIVDTIEFIRALNRVLQVFHIGFLQALDTKLQQIEQRLEAPFDWTRRIISEVQNAIDRIVTLDGLLQRITLIKSLASYAPEWLRIAVAARKKPLTDDDVARVAARARGGLTADVPGAIAGSLRERGSVYDAFTNEFAAAWQHQIEAA